MQFAAQPDVVRELVAVADDLERAPRDADRYDLVHGRVIAGRRVRQLAGMIATVDPTAPTTTKPLIGSVRAALYGRAKPRRAGAGQLELVV